MDPFWTVVCKVMELTKLPFEDFGVSSLLLVGVLDLKTLFNNELGTGPTAEFPSPDFSCVNAHFMFRMMRDERFKKEYFVGVEDSDLHCFSFRRNIERTPASPSHSEECSKSGLSINLCEECSCGGNLTRSLHKCLSYLNNRAWLLEKGKRNMRPRGINVNRTDLCFCFGCNLLHNSMNCCEHICSELLGYLAKADKHPGVVFTTVETKYNTFDVTQLQFEVFSFFNAVDQEIGHSVLALMKFRASDDDVQLRKNSKQGKAPELARFHGGAAGEVIRRIVWKIESWMGLVKENSWVKPDLQIFQLLFYSFAKVRTALGKTPASQPDGTYSAEDLEKRIKELELAQVPAIICIDYLRTRLGRDLFKAVGFLELFVTSGAREEQLAAHGLTSANLSDQPGEAAHRFIKLANTNERFEQPDKVNQDGKQPLGACSQRLSCQLYSYLGDVLFGMREERSDSKEFFVEDPPMEIQDLFNEVQKSLALESNKFHQGLVPYLGNNIKRKKVSSGLV